MRGSDAVEDDSKDKEGKGKGDGEGGAVDGSSGGGVEEDKDARRAREEEERERKKKEAEEELKKQAKSGAETLLPVVGEEVAAKVGRGRVLAGRGCVFGSTATAYAVGCWSRRYDGLSVEGV